MKRIFIAIYHFFEQHRWVMWLTLLLLTALCVISALNIHFEEDISSFMPKNAKNQRINEAYKHLSDENQIIIKIAAKDTTEDIDYELLEEAADDLAFRIDSIVSEDESRYGSASILYQIEQEQMDELTTFVVQNMPYYLEEKDYARIDTLLSREKMCEQLSIDRQLLMTPVGSLRTLLLHDPLLFSSRILQNLNTFRPDNGFQLVDGYLFSNDGNEAIIVVKSSNPMSETSRNAKLIEALDNVCQQIEKESDNQVICSHFGPAEISLTNARQIQKDSLTAVILSLIFILALLAYYYRNARSIGLILLSSLAGGLFALAIISLCKSSVSVIAIGVASIIIGIAINYPIHVLSHFKRTDDKEQIIRDIVTPLLIGNITTVGAFASLLFISSDAMKDLGLFAALLLVGTILFVLIFVPQLMGKHYKGKDRSLTFAKVAEFRPEKYNVILLVLIVLTVFLFFFSKKSGFDTNMHHINYMTDNQRIELDKLMANADTNNRNLYCIVESSSFEEALTQHEKMLQVCDSLSENGTSISVSGLGQFVPSKQLQKEKLQRWNNFWTTRRSQFIENLNYATKENGFAENAFDACKELISAEYEVQESDYFLEYFQQTGGNYIWKNEKDDETSQFFICNIVKAPSDNVQNIENQINNIDNNIFAFSESSIASRLVSSLSDDFDYVLFICGFLVFTFLMISFGRIELSLMAFLPLVIAWIWILGIMGLCHLQFNIVNIILATFIFGMGDDYSIFVTEGLIYEYRFGRKMLSQFKNSIILSASIMFLSIGMLIFAKHPAMKSLAEITIVGMFSVVMMAYIVPPFIFKWLTQRHGRPRKRVITLLDIGRMFVLALVFFFGSILMNVTAWILLGICGKSERHKKQYHKLLQKTLHFVAWVMPQVKYNVENPNNEDFSKPAVIISNHQSHFDLVYTLMLSPKIVVMTNQWAWNFPIYCSIVRGAEFMPASDGMEDNLQKIKELIAKGYSVLIYPEGTRSEDCHILRFHQGAFWVAQELGVDILPLMLHGVGQVLPKHSILVHDGSVTLRIGQRISPDNETFRQVKTVIEQTRIMRHYYREQYELMVSEKEDAYYFKEEVKRNYKYKGIEVARECRRKLKDFDKIAQWINTLPDSGEYVIDDCGQGEIALLAALVKKNLQITAYCSNEDQLDTARNCASIPDNLRFEVKRGER